MADQYAIVTTEKGVEYLEKNGRPTICTFLTVIHIGDEIRTSPCLAQCPFFMESDGRVFLNCRSISRSVSLEPDNSVGETP